jgi:hypothetical protein
MVDSKLFILLIVFFLIFFRIISRNIFVWWIIFFLLSLITIFLGKFYLINFIVLLNYFLFQEVLAFLFIINLRELFIFFVLLIKIGIRPLHLWIFLIFNSINSFILLWFLVLNKIPYINIILLFSLRLIIIIILGLILLFFQMFKISNMKILIILLRVESLNWIIIINIGEIEFIEQFFIYLFIGLYFLGYNRIYNFYSFEKLLFILSSPLIFIFFLKINFIENLSLINNNILIQIFLTYFLNFISILYFLEEVLLRLKLNFNKNYDSMFLIFTILMFV